MDPSPTKKQKVDQPKKFVLHPDLAKKLEEFRTKRNFVVGDWIQKKCEMFNDYMKKAGLKACVVNVSGGIDSAVTLALCLKAAEQKDSPIKKVQGIAQPIHSTKKIWERALELKDALGADIVTVDQSSINTELQASVEKAFNIEGKGFSRGQLRSYMRTPVAYFAAQLISQDGLPCVVMGTGNQDEDGYLMYFCKAGDGVADVQLINDLHKREVYMVGKELGVPKSILESPPSADLWEGQTDEEELGFNYDFVELYTTFLDLEESEKTKFKSGLSSEALAQLEESGAKAQSIHKRNKHKANFPFNINIL